tara:strand:+ start:1180 stop:1494 length:315 start_codon:yes stop_codon:yes gene_type:complete
VKKIISFNPVCEYRDLAIGNAIIDFMTHLEMGSSRFLMSLLEAPFVKENIVKEDPMRLTRRERRFKYACRRDLITYKKAKLYSEKFKKCAEITELYIKFKKGAK